MSDSAMNFWMLALIVTLAATCLGIAYAPRLGARCQTTPACVCRDPEVLCWDDPRRGRP